MPEDKNLIDALPDADTHLSNMIDIENDSDPVDSSFLEPEERDQDDNQGNNHDQSLDRNVNKNADNATRAELESERRLRLQREDEARVALEKNHELEEENLTFRRAFATSQKEKYEESIRGKERELVKAEEDGDSADKVRLQGEIADLRHKKSEIETAISRIPDAPIKRKEAEKPKQDANKNADRGENTALARWRQNNPWFDNPKTDEEWKKRKRALDLDILLRQKGKDHYSDDFYNEVNEKVKEMVDSRNNRGGDGGNNQNGNNGERKSPVSGSRPTDAVRNNNNNSDISRAKDGKIKVKITDRDKEVMQELGLDPNDPGTRKTYAMEKYKTAQRESRKEFMN